MGFDWSGGSYRTHGAAFHAVRLDPAALACPQAVRLLTCNREEVFYFDPCPQSGRTRAALTYLFRIASGLESMILGEYQILGQVKAAYRTACADGRVGKELDRIFRDAITCAKRVRTTLDIGAVPPSVCRAGLNIVEERIGLAGRRVFVIGSGRTGSLAAEIAAEKGARSIAVCNRSPDRAQRLADALGAEIVPYEARYRRIAASDIVVSATSSPHTVVEAARLRVSRPVAFLDLAVPRDVEAAVAELPGVTVIGIDTIGSLAAGNRAERERLVAQGMQIVREAVDKTEEWLNGL